MDDIESRGIVELPDGETFMDTQHYIPEGFLVVGQAGIGGIEDNWLVYWAREAVDYSEVGNHALLVELPLVWVATYSRKKWAVRAAEVFHHDHMRCEYHC